MLNLLYVSFIVTIILNFMVLSLTMTFIKNIWFSIKSNFLTSRPWKFECFCWIFLYFFINFYFKFFKFLLYLFVEMSYILEEIFVIVFFFFFRIVDVLSIGPNMVYCTLDHAWMSNVLRECIPAVNIALSCYHRTI